MSERAQAGPRPGVINACVLACLIGGLFTFNYAVDPFAWNRSVDLGLDKQAVAYDLSNYAWKYPEYLHDPRPVVVFGDSRARRLPEEAFEQSTGLPAYNFAFGGATAGDVIETFWFAAKQGKLERAYLGLGALLLNDGVAVERGRRDRELLTSPLRYYFSPFITSASAQVMLRHLFGIAGPGETPPMDAEAFWTYQLTVPPRQYYGGFVYPERLLTRLAAVAEYCEGQGIELIFFMPPTHVDLQAKREEFGIEVDYQRALVALRALAPVYDWDYPNEVTTDADLFTDPFHPTDEVAMRVALELAGRARAGTPPGFARKSVPPSALRSAPPTAAE
jgi:hypothetical protein